MFSHPSLRDLRMGAGAPICPNCAATAYSCICSPIIFMCKDCSDKRAIIIRWHEPGICRCASDSCILNPTSSGTASGTAGGTGVCTGSFSSIGPGEISIGGDIIGTVSGHISRAISTGLGGMDVESLRHIQTIQEISPDSLAIILKVRPGTSARDTARVGEAVKRIIANENKRYDLTDPIPIIVCDTDVDATTLIAQADSMRDETMAEFAKTNYEQTLHISALEGRIDVYTSIIKKQELDIAEALTKIVSLEDALMEFMELYGVTKKAEKYIEKGFKAVLVPEKESEDPAPHLKDLTYKKT